MKIFNEINGKKSVYVQAVDIQKINDLGVIGGNYSVPTSIWGKSFIKNAQLFNNPNNKYKYIKFNESHELYFFEQNELNFILEYDFLDKLDVDAISTKIEKCRARIKTLKTTDELKIEELNYMIETLEYVLNLKKQGRKLPVPDDLKSTINYEPKGVKKFINIFTNK